MIPSKAREGLYCWVTWLTKLVAGETHCAWAPWTKSRVQYRKRPSDFDFAAWRLAHTAALRKSAQGLEQDGWTVTVEDQNAFRWSHGDLTVAGKPDIIAKRDGETLIRDIKTGKRRDSDLVQVSIYRLHHESELGELPRGDLAYNDGMVTLGEEIEKLRPEIIRTLDLIASPGEPNPRPSERECQWCDLDDCPVRWGKRPEGTERPKQ